MDAERGLMERVAKGDQGAFSDLAQRYSGKLLAVAGRLLGSRADAEDAVQRAFLQCYAGAAGYNPRWAVSTWLYRILTNVCVDELRRRATRTAHDERSAAGPALVEQPPAARRLSRSAPGVRAGAARGAGAPGPPLRGWALLRGAGADPRHHDQYREEPARAGQGPAAR